MTDEANKSDGAGEDGSPPYDVPPTPRTYVAQSWKRPEMRRNILSRLAHDYDWYLDRMLAGMYEARNWPRSDLADCAADVKAHFFCPSDEDMNSETRRFWIGGWDRAAGPLRWYFLRCVRNFAVDRRRRRKSDAAGVSTVPLDDDGGFALRAGGPTPEQAVLAQEFEARYDKQSFIDRALLEYKTECGAGGDAAADRWRVYSRYISVWPLPKMEDLAKKLGMTRSTVNNHIHNSRARVMDLFWLLVRGMEIDDDAADQAMLAMVGKLPPCRAKRNAPRSLFNGHGELSGGGETTRDAAAIGDGK